MNKDSGRYQAVFNQLLHKPVIYNAVEDAMEIKNDLRLDEETNRRVFRRVGPTQGVYFINDGEADMKIGLYTSLLNSFGTGITEVKFSDSLETLPYGSSKEDSKTRKILVPETVCYGDVSIPIEDESSGTKRLIKTAFTIFNALYHKEGVILIDELDAGLHDILSTEIVKQFIVRSNDSKCQLIFTTHNTRLMGSHLLRKDQIWFTQMTPGRTTDLYSLSDLDNAPRPTADFAEDYLNGRYGAVPAIQDSMSQGVV